MCLRWALIRGGHLLKEGANSRLKYKHFEEIVETDLDKHAPKKKKMVRANNKPYVTKATRKAIMKPSELAKKFRNRPTDDNKKAFKKQKNFCNRLQKRETKVL